MAPARAAGRRGPAGGPRRGPGRRPDHRAAGAGGGAAPGGRPGGRAGQRDGRRGGRPGGRWPAAGYRALRRTRIWCCQGKRGRGAGVGPGWVGVRWQLALRAERGRGTGGRFVCARGARPWIWFPGAFGGTAAGVGLEAGRGAAWDPVQQALSWPPSEPRLCSLRALNTRLGAESMACADDRNWHCRLLRGRLLAGPAAAGPATAASPETAPTATDTTQAAQQQPAQQLTYQPRVKNVVEAPLYVNDPSKAPPLSTQANKALAVTEVQGPARPGP